VTLELGLFFCQCPGEIYVHCILSTDMIYVLISDQDHLWDLSTRHILPPCKPRCPASLTANAIPPDAGCEGDLSPLCMSIPSCNSANLASSLEYVLQHVQNAPVSTTGTACTFLCSGGLRHKNYGRESWESKLPSLK